MKNGLTAIIPIRLLDESTLRVRGVILEALEHGIEVILVVNNFSSEERERIEGHKARRIDWERGNPPPPRNEKERTERHMAALKADPERYAHYVRGNKEKPKSYNFLI